MPSVLLPMPKTYQNRFLGSSVSMNGPMQFVLHLFEKLARGLCRRVIVESHGVYVRDFLVETTLRKANLADDLQLLLKSSPWSGWCRIS